MKLLFLPPGEFQYASEIPLSLVKQDLRARRADRRERLVRAFISTMHAEGAVLRFGLTPAAGDKGRARLEAEVTEPAKQALETHVKAALDTGLEGYEIIGYARLNPTSHVPITITDVIAFDVVEGYGEPDYRTTVVPGLGSLVRRIRLCMPGFDEQGQRTH